MKKKLAFCISVFLVCITTLSSAQNITGTWEGFMHNEYLQINIDQQGTKICGFTYDFVINDRKSFCKAYYHGRYENGFLLLTGTSFISNSGAHVLMTIGLLTTTINGVLVLQGKVSTSTFRATDFSDNYDAIITLKRVSPTPRNAPGTTAPCYQAIEPKVVPEKNLTPAEPAKKDPPITKKVIAKPPVKPSAVASKPPVKNVPKPIVTTKPVQKTVPVAPKKMETKSPASNIVLPPKLAVRVQEEQNRITVKTNKISLKLYDNGTVDGDTVSVYYNGKLLVDRKKLGEQPIEINLNLDPNVTSHTITLYAENLGSIPPNTALIVVTAGNKRYELRSSADLKKNAVLVFDYIPEN